MTSTTESTGKQIVSTDAVTAQIPRVVVLHPHDASFTTEPLPIVRAPRATGQQRVPAPGQKMTTGKARASAPPLLRLTVTMLIFMFLASMGGVVAERSHPKWFIGLEHFIHPGQTPLSTRHAQLLKSAVLVSSTPTTAVYQVPSASYSIAISVDHPCWFVVKSLAGSSPVIAALTMSPAASPMSIPVHGSSSLTVAARTRAVTVFHGSKVLVSIENPRVGVIYTFISKT